MKKILLICTNFPWPPTDGERLRTYNLIKEIGKRAKLTVVHPGPEALPLDLINSLSCSVEWVAFRRRMPSALVSLRSVLSITPVFYSLAYSPDLARWLQNLPRGAFDAVHLDGLPAFNYWRFATKICPNVVVDLRDSWSLLYRRIYKTTEWSLIKLIKTYLVSRIERKIIENASKLVLISDVDAHHLDKIYPKVKKIIDIIPNGISDEFFKIKPRPISCKNPVLAFTGAMDYSPNAQAAIFFSQEIIPLVKQRHPNVRFLVIGKNPGSELSKLTSDSVIVTGEVKSVAAELEQVDIVVAPLISGAGMKNKVLEALAANRPLVASKVAVEGIELLQGTHYLLADSIDQWVKSIDSLISQPELAGDMALKGREQVREMYSWQLAAKKFNNLYERNLYLSS